MGNEEQEIFKKRKVNGQDYQISRDVEGHKNDFLALSLSSYFPSAKPSQLSTGNHHSPSASPPPPSSHSFNHHPIDGVSQSHFPPSIGLHVASSVGNTNRQAAAASRGPSGRVRRNPSQSPRGGKSAIVPAPFPWATTQRATVYSLGDLLSRQIFTISGDVQCKKCEKKYQMEFDLKQKFLEVWTFIAENKGSMHDRAPAVWINPNLPGCSSCKQENCVKPLISNKKKSINWLFLLLGQMLGCCTLEQLKYFCKHTRNHRTGAKDRVLYLTYLGLCKQLDPNGPFDR
ncbi:unnamed protein product [Fraxinus pennsylvanica]|uniref:DUF7086 domain-containing protein n=1 Tax=Fraxinus pennsylvanica TaxID=56036 RepID=A0AAD2AAZ7_9LAMI|nr:unnamed protein product [Fraxinus pennsylvanica]